MARRHKPTGGKPGAPKGNSNAHKHGFHSQTERAERLRAHSAARGARALQEALKLDDANAAMAAVKQAEADMEDRDAAWRELWRAARRLPTFRGALADIIRNRMAAEWIGLFPDEAAPDWVYAWLDAMPNIHHSPPLEDGDDVLPGVPETPWTDPSREEEGGGTKNSETTPPPIHPRSLWNELFPGRDWGNVTSFDPDVADRLFLFVPQFGSRLHAEAYLTWKMRQFAAHRDEATSKDEHGPSLNERAMGGGVPIPRNPLPWRVIGTPPVVD